MFSFKNNKLWNIEVINSCQLVYATDLNYWIKHPFEFSDPILKPEYL